MCIKQVNAASRSRITAIQILDYQINLNFFLSFTELTVLVNSTDVALLTSNKKYFSYKSGLIQRVGHTIDN